MITRSTIRSATRLGARVATPVAGVINRYNPTRSDTAENQLYNNNGAPGALGAFVLIGLFPCTPGQAITMSLTGAASNWTFNAARVNFHSGTPASSANLVSSVTAGVTVSADFRTITVAGANVPSGATHATTNVKYLVNGIYSSSNVIPAGALAAMLPSIMVNDGAVAACLTDFGTGTLATDTAPAALAPGELLLLKNGATWLARTRFTASKDLVDAFLFEEPSVSKNGGWAPASVVQIPIATSTASTTGAYAADLVGTPTNANTLNIISDNVPALQINATFLGGGEHGLLGWRYTAAAHGKQNVDLGSRWSTGGVTYVLAQCPTTGTITFAQPITGTYASWARNGTSPGSGVTFTHVSGATNTADIVTTGAPTQVNLTPGSQNVTYRALTASGQALTVNGAWRGKLARIRTSYSIPNLLRLQEWMVARAGTNAPMFFNDTSIGSQVSVASEYMYDGWRSRSVRFEVTTIEAHSRTFLWPGQFQQINPVTGSGETLWYLIPNTNAFQSGLTQTGGTSRDFSQWSNVTSNTLEYYTATGTLKAGSHWSDGVQRPVRATAYEVRSSGNTPRTRFVMVSSAIQGLTATNDYSTISHFFSGGNKSYLACAYEQAVAAGNKVSYVAASGFMDLTLDVQADISFAFPLFGGGYEWVWSSRNGALSNYAIPLPPQLAGRRLEIVNRTASATVSIAGDVVTVTTTGDAYITFKAS